jgi:nitrite reductase/ring-hydroxylating ferredoxin subunit
MTQREALEATMQAVKIANWSEVPDRSPVGVLVDGVDLVIVRFDDNHSVLYGRCLHRGALMADGHVEDDNLICGLHGWDYVFHTGVSSYDNAERLAKFSSWIDDDSLMVDGEEILSWIKEHPQPYDRDSYQGEFQDPHGDPAEPHVGLIRRLANEGLEYLGHHGPVTSMGVSREELPKWDNIQFVTAQLARKPQLDEVAVATEVVIGPNADKPLRLEIPLFVSDMSYGALSEEAKVALSKGAELAGTGICSGEGGMLPEEHAENSRYFYELASGKFGWSIDKVADVQAFHFKLGQGAKTGTGGHLPGIKVKGKIAEVRGLEPGHDAISPSTFTDLNNEDDFRRLADEVREVSGGVPIGVKLSAQHIEDDIDAALRVGVDYIILDGRGGGTTSRSRRFRP